MLELGYCSIFEFLSRPTSVWQLSTEQPVNALLDVGGPFAANLEQKWFTTTREGDRDASGVGPKKFWQKLPVDQNAEARGGREGEGGCGQIEVRTPRGP